MSTEEDTELKDLILQTLEDKGIISKLKAELRSKVFLALDEHGELQNATPSLELFKEFVNTKEGLLVTSLVKEFLEFFSFDYTLSIFEPEIATAEKNLLSKEEICSQLSVGKHSNKGPILENLVKEHFDTFRIASHKSLGSSKIHEDTQSFIPQVHTFDPRKKIEPVNPSPLIPSFNSKETEKIDVIFSEIGLGDDKPIFSVSADKTMFPKRPQRTEFGSNFNSHTTSSLSSLKDLPALNTDTHSSTKDSSPFDTSSNILFQQDSSKLLSNTKKFQKENQKPSAESKDSISEDIKTDEDIEEDLNINDLETSSEADMTADNTLNSSLQDHCDYIEPVEVHK